MRNLGMVALAALTLAGCAGRDAQPIATVQPQDAYSDCAMITAEIEANNAKVNQLANEKGWKVAQNVGAGVVGLVIWPVWFGMDFKDAAGTDAAALQARQQYLANLATLRCAPPPRPAAVVQRAPPRRSPQPAPPAAK